MNRTQHLLVIALFTVAPAHAETLRLDADNTARMAVRASKLTLAASSRVEASESAVSAADAARLPVISANASYVSRSAVPEFGVPTDDPSQPVFILFPNIENTYSADVTLTQPIYAGGGIAANRERARLDEQAANWSQNLTAIDLGHAARRLYWTAVATAAGLDVTAAQLRRAERLLDDARALRGAGMAVSADVYAAEARTAAANLDVIRAQTANNQALARVRSLLGIEAGTTIDLADASTTAVPPPPASPAALETRALEGRPELKMAGTRIDGLGASAKATNAARLPAIGLSAHWMVAQPNQRFLPPVDEANDSWGIGVSASWKFFDGSRTKEQVATVRAEQRALQADRGELERQIRLEVEIARLELHAALEAVTSADASAAAAAAWEEASSERYTAGLALISELLDAQADLTAAEVARVRTRAGAWMAAAALDRAVGR